MNIRRLIALSVGALALLALVPVAEAGPDKTAKKKFVDRILAKYDVDGDGRLSMDERRAWFADRRAAALVKYDSNKNGELDPAERKVMARDRATAVLAALDGDKDGKLSRLEVGKARGLRFQRLQRGFERIDVDGDGFLSRSELESFRRRRGMRGMRGQPDKRPRMRSGGDAI